MKNSVLVTTILLLSFITSCAPSASAIATQTSIGATTSAAQWTKTPSPTPSGTPTFTPTSTNTPTVTPIPEWVPDYETIYSDTREITLGDIIPNADPALLETKLFDLTIITDESYMTVCGNRRVVKFNDGYKALSTKDHAHADQVLARAFMKGLYSNSLRYSTELQELFRATDGETAYAQFVELFAQGKEFPVKINTLDDKPYSLQKANIKMPEEVRFVFYSAGNYRIKSVDKERSDGANVTPDGKIMAIYAGLHAPGFLLTGMGLSQNIVSAIFDSMSLSYNAPLMKTVANGIVYGDNSALVCRNK